MTFLGKVQCPAEIPRGGKGRAVWGQMCQSPKWHRMNSFDTTFRENQRFSPSRSLKHNPIIYLNTRRKIYFPYFLKNASLGIHFMFFFFKLIFLRYLRPQGFIFQKKVIGLNPMSGHKVFIFEKLFHVVKTLSDVTCQAIGFHFGQNLSDP